MSITNISYWLRLAVCALLPVVCLAQGECVDNFPDRIEQVLEATRELRLRGQHDSSIGLLKRVLQEIDDSKAVLPEQRLRLELALGQSYLSADRRKLAFATLRRVEEQSGLLKAWGVNAAGHLALGQLHVLLDQQIESREHLDRARMLIRRHDLQQFTPLHYLESGWWQHSFGFIDSVSYHLGKFYQHPNQPEDLMARAHTLRASGLRYKDNDRQAAAYQDAINIYHRLGDHQNLAKLSWQLTSVYLLEDSNYEKVISQTDSTIRYAYESIARGQNPVYSLAVAYQQKAKYFLRYGPADSTLSYASKGYSLENQYWRTQERDKVVEMQELHRNEKRETTLKQQAEQLLFERRRALALTVLTGLILALSIGTLFFYRQLQAASQLTRQQASALETANEALTETNYIQVILKAELAHRTKNNLALILSLVNQRQFRVADPMVRAALAEDQERIESIALVHQSIEVSQNSNKVNCEQYLGKLVSNIQHSYSGILPNVKLHLNLVGNLVQIDTAVPLGLIVNELVTNAYKHAFPTGREGNVCITFCKLPSGFFLRVSDDGVGNARDIRTDGTNAIGIRLIKSLVHQIGGTIEWLSAHPGLMVHIRFQQ